jgi:hypothetical protein
MPVTRDARPWEGGIEPELRRLDDRFGYRVPIVALIGREPSGLDHQLDAGRTHRDTDHHGPALLPLAVSAGAAGG